MYECQERKEVKIMNYTKPQISVRGSALAAIQGTVEGKPMDILFDSNAGHVGERNETPGAYECDE
jgi:hypothetical protein